MTFAWDQKAYYNHIESVCRALGEYQGKEYRILDLLKDLAPVRIHTEYRWWGYRSNTALTVFDGLDDAIKWFMVHEPLPELE